MAKGAKPDFEEVREDRLGKGELYELDERADRKRTMFRNPEARYTMCDMADNEFTGQCIGGPDDGNLVTSTTEEWICVVTFFRVLDPGRAYTDVVSGTYEWNAQHGGFHWNGGNNARQG